MKTACLVVNPISGRGKAPLRAALAVPVLERAGVRVAVHETTRAGEARERVREWGAGADAVVVVGGDGTLSEVIGGLGGEGQVALIPSGTANVVARDLRIALAPERAARQILDGRPVPLDLGVANGRLFLAMVGVGFDGEIVRRLGEGRAGPITMASYVAPVWQALRRPAAVGIRLGVDGRWIPETFSGVIVSNTRNYGGLFSVTPDARPDDGVFDFQARRGSGRGRLLCWGLAGALRRRLASRLALYGRGRSFTVEADAPAPVQVDGDFLGTTPVTIEVREAAARIIAPRRPGVDR